MSTPTEKTGTCHDPQLKQLRRIEGQIRGICKMIEDRRYCVDILSQMKAVRSSLASVEKKIVTEHINHCVHKAVESASPKDLDHMLSEIKDLLKSARL